MDKVRADKVRLDKLPDDALDVITSFLVPTPEFYSKRPEILNKYNVSYPAMCIKENYNTLVCLSSLNKSMLQHSKRKASFLTQYNTTLAPYIHQKKMQRVHMQMEEVWFAYQVFHPSIHYKDYDCIVCHHTIQWKERYPSYSVNSIADYENNIWSTDTIHEAEENNICVQCMNDVGRCMNCDILILPNRFMITDPRFCCYECKYDFKYNPSLIF
jgi:hypothetical protein